MTSCSSPTQGADRPAATGSGSRRRELLDHLDHRPVGDALAVGEAAAADDRAPSSESEELGDQPRLADAGRPEDREQLAGAVAERPGRTRRGDGAARVSRPTIGARRGGAEPWSPCTDEQAVGRHRLGLALQRERLDRLDLDRVAGEPQRLLADQDLAGLRRPARAARRR